MNNRNLDDREAYTELSAQRRHRRRPEAEQEVFRTPETQDPASVPVNPEEADAPRSAAGTQAGEEREEPAAAGTLSGEKPEEPVTEARPGDERDESAAEARPVRPAASDAGSRVPPEARRMTAAPYGTARPDAKRPGTRPQVAPRRPPLPEEKRVTIQPRREPVGAERPVSGGMAAGKPSHVRVGYAPGRMNEEMTQQIPSGETVREAMHARDARAYLEKRKQPFQTGKAEKPEPDRPGSRTLRILTALLVTVGIVLAGILVIKDRMSGDSQVPRGPVEVMSFEIPETEGLTAPSDLTFLAVTAKDAEGIRLVADNGKLMDTETTFGDNADGKLWMMKMHVETGFTGVVTLQVRRSGSEEWVDTEYTANMSIAGPLNADDPAEDAEAPAETAPPAELPEPAEQETEDGPGNGSEAEPAEEAGAEADDDYWDEGPEEDTWAEVPEDEADAEEAGAEDAWEPDEETPVEDDGEQPAEAAGDDEAEIPLTGELRTVQPTETPAPEEAKPTETPPLTVEAAPEANPDLIVSTAVYIGKNKEKAYSRPAKELIHMPAADEYTTKKLGVMTFRGDNFRRNAAVGTLRAAPEKLSVLWEVEGGSARGTSQTYYGYGWPGQPAIARWSTQVRSASNLYESKQEKDALKEVIIAGLDGNIRFLDLEDGSLTRNSIKLGYPMRGTPSLHTRGAPFISVGQFARKMKVKTGKIGLRQYNLYSQKELKLIDGLDGKYHRPLNEIGSFETSALVDRISDTLIVAGTNGTLYLEALNSSFDYNAGVLSIAPSITMMTSKAQGQKNMALTAVESSLAAYDRYVFYADMGGVLRCVDTNTLTPVWAVDTGDSVMAAVALDLTDSRELNLYTANMLNNRKKGDGNIQIRRYDALSGRESWCTDIGVYKGKKDKDDVGAKASPVIGQHQLKDLVYFTVTGLSEEGRNRLGLGGEEEAAVLLALDKETGKTVWSAGLSSRSESSPIAVYDTEGNGWIIQCEQNGTIHLLEGLTGREVDTLKLEAEIEASPAAYGNVMVIGTTGKGTSYIYGIEFKLARAQESEGDDDEYTGGT